MKKISILSLHLNYGGIEKSICELSNLLVNNYKVEIVCSYNLCDIPAFYIDPRVEITYLINHDKPNKEEFKNALKKLNFFKIIKEGLYSCKVLFLRKKTMVKYIKNTNSNIIISSRDIFNKWTGKYAKDNIVKIAWEHNNPHGNMKYAKKVINSVKKMDYLVLVSKGLKEFYSKRLNKVKCVYIPNIVDSIPKEKSSLKNKNLVSIGRLSKEKGYMDLLYAYTDIIKKYPDWKLDIIGDGDEKENLEKYINENKLTGKVFLHGFQNKNYINNILLNSSIYLMTSFTESFGIVLIEAMSYGLPCISYSSAEGACELIVDNKNGYLIDDRNKDEYVNKVIYLIENYSVREKMKEESIKTAEKYTGENVVKLWLKLLKEGK